MKKKTFILCLAIMFLPFWASAHDFEVDGIYYSFGDIILVESTDSSTDLTVAVTYRGFDPSDYINEYAGEITIPETVTYNGETYRVTSIERDAFNYCSNLTSIIIPKSVTSVGYLPKCEKSGGQVASTVAENTQRTTHYEIRTEGARNPGQAIKIG